MKFGAHIYLWVERWSDSTLWLLDRARELGLACIEIACGDDISIDVQRTRRHAQASGIELILSPGAHWPMACDISDDDPANRRLGLDWHRRNIDLSAAVGATAYTGAIYGHPGRVHQRIPPADEYPRTAENLHRLAQHAAAAGVKLVLEPMSHFRTHLVNTSEQAMRLIDLAGHPNLLVLLDTYHLVTEVRDFVAAVHAAGPRLWGLHACENDRGVPGGGLLPWPAILAAVAQTPARHVLFESYNSSIPGFAIGRGMFHDVCPDGDAFVRRGLDFLRPLVEPPPALRFAVLRHEQIDSPHFDLLIELEAGQPLATWRCEEWPIVRPAIINRLPDHRPLYLDYEGPISGNRGHVRRVASGACRVTFGPEGALIVELLPRGGSVEAEGPHPSPLPGYREREQEAPQPPTCLRLTPIEGDQWRASPQGEGITP